MTAPLQILRTTRELLADPRRWIKSRWGAYRDERGVVRACRGIERPNCWCLGGAINVALNMNLQRATMAAFTELRSDCERELLATLGEPLPAIYMFNDRATTAHADVIGLLDKAIDRLSAAA